VKHIRPFAAILLLLSGCSWLIPWEARVNHAYAEVLQEWRAANPDAELTEEVKALLMAKAEDKARNDETADRDEAITQATDAANKFGRGDIVGGVLATLGVAMLGIGAVKKRRQIMNAPSVSASNAADPGPRAIPDGGSADGGGGGSPGGTA
jgi:hypothetical protein